MKSLRLSRVGVVGGGILGLAVAREVGLKFPGVAVTVFEKEDQVATHQSGHNSGVIHAGLYYKPGSLKAQLCIRGASQLREYCEERRIAIKEVGKLIVAVSDSELSGLADIEERAIQNRVRDVRRVNVTDMSSIEPYVQGVAGLYSPHTAAVDYVDVCKRLAQDVVEAQGTVKLATPVTRMGITSSGVELWSDTARMTFDRVIACAGLQSDRIARMVAHSNDSRVVPFRGEYYSLQPDARHRVHGMIYPVPDPRYPFLGIHLTRDSRDHVHVGPNAVLALGLESYQWSQMSPRDLAGVLSWPGTWRLMREHWRYGLRELAWSLSKRSYVEQVRKYLPSLSSSDLVASDRGVRAQAVSRRGKLIDDFVLKEVGPVTLVLNAPSPAATSSLAIAERIVAGLNS